MPNNLNTSVKESLIKRIKSRPVAIWGARMTGMGFARFLKSNCETEAICFIDSDISLENKKINNVPIHNSNKLQSLKEEYPDLIIVIAVALKEYEIIEILKKSNFNEDDYVIYSEYSTDFYTIDVVGSCNLSCPSCAHGSSDMQSPTGIMNMTNFESVVDKMMSESAVVSHVSLYSWGEPFLNKELPNMISSLHERGIAVAISSNLSINFEKRIESVMKIAPDYLKVSLSGFYEDAYNDTHTGGDINLVKSNLYKLRYLINKYKTSTLVDVNYHLYNNNCGKNLEKMKELCLELDFSLSSTYSLIMPLERVLNHCDGNSTKEVEILNNKLLVNIDEGIKASSGTKMKGCPFRENQVNINWDLSVPICCTVYNRNKETVLTNNYLETPLSEITKRKQNVDLCKKCMSLELPAYNMGFNQDKWKEIASTKECKDLD